ncbi:MAG: hypothetical protein IPF83_12330 [Rhodanobacteraceae bacterium]|nr:hypothetical protein [Rhodanobacteraceae bacterium]
MYSTDFEADDGGFTHSGMADEWALGLPATVATTTTNPVAGFTTCNQRHQLLEDRSDWHLQRQQHTGPVVAEH